MSDLTSSREGRLCLNGKRIPIPNKQVIDPYTFIHGDLTIDVTKENIHATTQSALDLFINPQGLTLPKGELEGVMRLDVVKKKYIPEWPSEKYLIAPLRQFWRSRRNLTRGWCMIISGALHRFFYKEFDLYRGKCLYNPNDYHWWLQNSNGDVIDMTEEQYRIKKIYEPRCDGEVVKAERFIRRRYAQKVRNVAIKIAEDISGSKFDGKLVPMINYDRPQNQWEYYKPD